MSYHGPTQAPEVVPLHLQELCLLLLSQAVHLSDETIGDLLEAVLGAALVVFRDMLVLLEAPQVLQTVATDVANGHAPFFHLLVDDPGQLAPSLLGQRRGGPAGGGGGGGRGGGPGWVFEGLLH